MSQQATEAILALGSIVDDCYRLFYFFYISPPPMGAVFGLRTRARVCACVHACVRARARGRVRVCCCIGATTMACSNSNFSVMHTFCEAKVFKTNDFGSLPHPLARPEVMIDPAQLTGRQNPTTN